MTLRRSGTPILRVRSRPLPSEKQTWTERLRNSTSAWREWLVDSLPDWPPKWLVDSLGPDYFGNVVSVSFTHRATDADLIQLGQLKRLERLDLYGSSVTDRGLVNLKGLPIFKPSFWFAPRLAMRGWPTGRYEKPSNPVAGRDRAERRGCVAFERFNRPRGPRSRQYPGQRCRAGAFEGIDQAPGVGSEPYRDHGCRPGSPRGPDRPSGAIPRAARESPTRD